MVFSMKNKTNLRSSLSIYNLELPVYLGWPKNERLRKQIISLYIHIQLSPPPRACTTDKLEDTICYSNMINKIRDHLAKKKFNLIEHVSYEIYQTIKSILHNPAKVMVTITKRPKIPEFSGNVSFCYSDEQ